MYFVRYLSKKLNFAEDSSIFLDDLILTLICVGLQIPTLFLFVQGCLVDSQKHLFPFSKKTVNVLLEFPKWKIFSKMQSDCTV